MTAIRGILFDKDGTLIDHEATWQPVYFEVAHHMSGGDEATARSMLEMAGYDFQAQRCRAGAPLSAGTTDEIVDLWVPELDAAARTSMIASVDAMFAEGARIHVKALDGMVELVRGFKRRGLKLGIATNDGTQSAQGCAEALDLDDVFDFIIGYDGVERPKPAPDMVYAFCQACSLKPGEIAVVGDSTHDVQMGQAAQVAVSVGVLSGSSSHDDLAADADVVVAGIGDLPRTLGLEL